MESRDVIIIGAGPAGLAAALELHRRGIRDILVLEREREPGGILRQCIHDGFGLTRFGESLSGPEYAQRFIEPLQALGVEIRTGTMVLDLGADRRILASTRGSLLELQARAVILAMGCRERTRGALSIPGQRPAGIYTAGVAQAYMNLQNTMVGKEIVILGSGDIGLIMARRLTLEGARVKAVFEILPYPSGLPRNLRQCLDDYGIPLYLSHSVVDIAGRERLESVTVASFDEERRPIPGTERVWNCDTLIISAGLIPENELSLAAGVELDSRTKGPRVDEGFQTNREGIFAAGNVLHVHDVVDFVSMEAEALAASVERYLGGRQTGARAPGHATEASESANLAVQTVGLPVQGEGLAVQADPNILYCLPQRISGLEDFTLCLRVRRPFRRCSIQISQGGKTVASIDLRKAVPAEMLRIPVEAAALDPRCALEVAVLCREPVGLMSARQKGEPDLSAFPRIAVIHGLKSALHSPHTPRMGLVHHQFSSRGCLALHENPKSDRLLDDYTCILCPRGCDIEVEIEGGSLTQVEGARCPRGRKYVESEIADPRRTIATSVLVEGGEWPLASVRLTRAIPKDRIFDAVAHIRSIRVQAPLSMGQILVEDLLGLGADVIVTRNVALATPEEPGS